MQLRLDQLPAHLSKGASALKLGKLRGRECGIN